MVSQFFSMVLYTWSTKFMKNWKMLQISYFVLYAHLSSFVYLTEFREYIQEESVPVQVFKISTKFEAIKMASRHERSRDFIS